MPSQSTNALLWLTLTSAALSLVLCVFCVVLVVAPSITLFVRQPLTPTSIAPPFLLISGLILFMLSCTCYVWGYSTISNRSKTQFKLFLGCNGIFSFLVIVTGLLLTVAFIDPLGTDNALGDAFSNVLDLYRDEFINLSQNVDTQNEWESVQNAFDCCGINAELLFQDGTVLTTLLSGAACEAVASNETLTGVLTDNSPTDDFEQVLVDAGFEIPFCETGFIESLKNGVPYTASAVAIISLVSLFTCILGVCVVKSDHFHNHELDYQQVLKDKQKRRDAIRRNLSAGTEKTKAISESGSLNGTTNISRNISQNTLPLQISRVRTLPKGLKKMPGKNSRPPPLPMRASKGARSRQSDSSNSKVSKTHSELRRQFVRMEEAASERGVVYVEEEEARNKPQRVAFPAPEISRTLGRLAKDREESFKARLGNDTVAEKLRPPPGLGFSSQNLPLVAPEENTRALSPFEDEIKPPRHSWETGTEKFSRNDVQPESQGEELGPPPLPVPRPLPEVEVEVEEGVEEEPNTKKKDSFESFETNADDLFEKADKVDASENVQMDSTFF